MADNTLSGGDMPMEDQDVIDERNAVVADLVARDFAPNQRLRYLGIAGTGSYGGALLFGEQNQNGSFFRKIVVKYSVGEEGDSILRNEAKWLTILQGGEHTVKMIPLAGTGLNVTGARHPTLAQEYVPNGTLEQFRQRYVEYWGERFALRKIGMPSRILWRIFHCMVRAVAGMAYPPRNADPNAENQREQPMARTMTNNMEHNTLHDAENFAFGNTFDQSEHVKVPILKVIDHGSASEADNWLEATRSNIWGIGLAMVWLALPGSRGEGWFPPSAKDYRVIIPGTFAMTTIQTQAPQEFLDWEGIDTDLKHILVRCMAADHYRIPELDELLIVCQRSINRRVNSFGNGFGDFERMNEEDEAVDNFVQRLIRNADAAAAPEPPVINQNLSRTNSNGPRQTGTSILGMFPGTRNVMAQEEFEPQTLNRQLSMSGSEGGSRVFSGSTRVASEASSHALSGTTLVDSDNESRTASEILRGIAADDDDWGGQLPRRPSSDSEESFQPPRTRNLFDSDDESPPPPQPRERPLSDTDDESLQPPRTRNLFDSNDESFPPPQTRRRPLSDTDDESLQPPRTRRRISDIDDIDDIDDFDFQPMPQTLPQPPPQTLPQPPPQTLPQPPPQTLPQMELQSLLPRRWLTQLQQEPQSQTQTEFQPPPPRRWLTQPLPQLQPQTQSQMDSQLRPFRRRQTQPQPEPPLPARGQTLANTLGNALWNLSMYLWDV